VTLEPPPLPFGVEDGKIHSPLEVYSQIFSPNIKTIRDISTTSSPKDDELFDAITSLTNLSDNLHKCSPIIVCRVLTTQLVHPLILTPLRLIPLTRDHSLLMTNIPWLLVIPH